MLSQRINTLSVSATVELSRRIAEMERNGRNIIKLNVGEPDFKTPNHINLAGQQAIDDGFTKYTPVNGIYELREAIVHKFQMDNDLNYSPDEIIVTTGAKQALFTALLAICNPGDEIIIPTPSWVSFGEMVKIAGGVPIFVPTREDYHFIPSVTDLQAAISDRTRAIIINSPNNPTGAVYPPDRLEAIAELADKFDMYILSDEIYEKLVYRGHTHVSIASFGDAIKQRTIVVNGVSKAFAMPGWRLGYAAAALDIIDAMCRLQGHMTTTTNSISQRAALAALTGSQQCLEAMRRKYEERRQFLWEQINQLPGLSCTESSGAFYLLVNVNNLFGKYFNGTMLTNAIDVAEFLLEAAHVAVVPGDAFQAPDHVRIAYANSMEQISRAMINIEQALQQLSVRERA